MKPLKVLRDSIIRGPGGEQCMEMSYVGLCLSVVMVFLDTFSFLDF